MSHPVKDALFGLVVGDALGVPVEFKSREELKKNQVTDMFGYGTHNQPPGTWSDDSSLALCLAEELTKGFNLNTISDSFVRWLYEGYWTAHGEVFDVGNSTGTALKRLKDGASPEESGMKEENTNGNGSLMRILPLLFYVRQNKDERERYELVRKVSAITHAHIRSTLSCFYYLELGRFILEGNSFTDSYQKANKIFLQLAEENDVPASEMVHFERLTNGNLHQLREEQIFSETYVVHTLEASVWCLLNTNNYPGAVLKAVNLGLDTDTTAAVTGGLAGLFYTAGKIPKKWLEQIVRLNDIEKVAEKLEDKYSGE
jgi:ADP-ribosylglycohydrolase